MNLKDLSTQLLFTTVPIWTETSTGQASATGFIYNVPVPNKEDHSIPFLITCNHVFVGAVRALIELVEREGDEPNRQRRVRVELPSESLQKNSSSGLDLAVIPLGGALNQLRSANREAFFRSITPDIVPSVDVMSNLSAMEEIVFFGYPSGLRDETNATPLIRRGITSTPVWNDYAGQPAFLIDAGVFPGSSGSPVFVLNQGSYAVRDGIKLGSRLIFLGMITQSMVRKDLGAQTFLGIGQVLKSSAIREFIDDCAAPLFATLE